MHNSTQVVHSLRIRCNSELRVQGCRNADLAAGVRQARVPGGEGPRSPQRRAGCRGRSGRGLAERSNRVGLEHARNEGQSRVARRERRHDLMRCPVATLRSQFPCRLGRADENRKEHYCNTENSCLTNANHYPQIDPTQYEHHNQLSQPSPAKQPPSGCEWLMQSMPRSIPELRRRRNSLRQNLNERLAARHARDRFFVQCNSSGALPWTREQTSRGDLAGVRRDVQAPQRRDGARDLGLSKESHDAKHRQATVVDLRAQPGKSWKVNNPQKWKR